MRYVFQADARLGFATLKRYDHCHILSLNNFQKKFLGSNFEARFSKKKSKVVTKSKQNLPVHLFVVC